MQNRFGGGSNLKQQYGTFAKFLEQFVIDYQISQAMIGARIGVSRPVISNWISGKNLPVLKRWGCIAELISEISGNHYRRDDILELLQAQGSASRNRQ